MPIPCVSMCAPVSMYTSCAVMNSLSRAHTLSLCLSVCPELEKQLRTERKQTSSLKNELKTASDCSNVAEESMSRTIDKQHSKVRACECACVCLLFMINHLQRSPVRFTRTSRMEQACTHSTHLHTHNHTQNLDLLHALATVSQHYQSRRAGESDATNPLSIGGPAN
jgi:hypothetical protein